MTMANMTVVATRVAATVTTTIDTKVSNLTMMAIASMSDMVVMTPIGTLHGHDGHCHCVCPGGHAQHTCHVVKIVSIRRIVVWSCQ